MSQGQPRRSQAENEPVKYGDVFKVSGELATKHIAPRDAAAMQAAETMVLGHTQKGGPAAVMQSAADVNERCGFVGHESVSDITRDRGLTIADTHVAGARVVTESVAGQVVGSYVQPAGDNKGSPAAGNTQRDSITIGEALEATALTVGEKPVEAADAAAIQAAEVRATGRGQVVPGGIAAEAQAAAALNPRTVREENKTKLGEILGDATERLPADKAVTREDAEGVIGAEIRNKADMSTQPGGVAASMAAAARLNQGK